MLKRRKFGFSEKVHPLIFGILSFIMYISVFASTFYLIPIQVIKSKHGRKYFFYSMAIVLTGILTYAIIVLSRVNAFTIEKFLFYILGPFSFAAGILFLNSNIMKKFQFIDRLITAGLIGSCFILPVILIMKSNAAIRNEIIEVIRSVVTVKEEGQIEEMDAVWLFDQTVQILNSSFCFFVTSVVFINYWIGSKIGNRIKNNNSITSASEISVRKVIIWPMLISWVVVLSSQLFGQKLLLTIFMNISLVLVFCYILQGLGIVTFFLNRWNLKLHLRMALVIGFAFFASLNMTILFAMLCVLALLGITETWIPLRQSKGVSNEGDIK